ncbi:hypothetical protein BJ742DRAFT_905493 [Cladochytrium replicatum]|nr:hypothetical protein BJ742DRAFT_905493 [Cladochytrium replicatum]
MGSENCMRVELGVANECFFRDSQLMMRSYFPFMGRPTILAVVAILLAVGALGVGVFYLWEGGGWAFVKTAFGNLLTILAAHPVPGFVIFHFVIYPVLTHVLFVPAGPLAIASGLLFRPPALAILGLILGGQVAVLITLTLSRFFHALFLSSATSPTSTGQSPKAKEWARIIRALNDAARNEGVKLVILMRIAMPLPFGVSSYLLASTSIKRTHLFVGTAIGNVPGVLSHVFLGTMAGSVSGIEEVKPDPKMIALTGYWAVVIFGYTFTYIFLRGRHVLVDAGIIRPPNSTTHKPVPTEEPTDLEAQDDVDQDGQGLISEGAKDDDGDAVPSVAPERMAKETLRRLREERILRLAPVVAVVFLVVGTPLIVLFGPPS